MVRAEDGTFDVFVTAVLTCRGHATEENRSAATTRTASGATVERQCTGATKEK
jgi:hypothetical protein